MRTNAKSNGWRFDKSSDSGLRPSAIEIFFDARPNFPFGDFRSCSGISFKFTFLMRESVRLNLAGGNSPSSCDGKNGYPCPNEVHKSGRIGSIKDCIRSQQKTAA